MFAEAFYWVLNMSISGSIVGTVVFVVRRFSFVPKRVSVWLWSLVLIRLVVPFGIGGRYGLMALLSKLFCKTVLVYAGDEVTVSATNFIQGADGYFPITYRSLWIADVFYVAAFIWLVVTVVLLILLTVQYIQMYRVVRRAKREGDVWRSAEVNGPFVFGVFRPKIVVPVAFVCDRYVILHERMHICRADNLWRLAAIGITCVHWFNPLVWFCLNRFLCDLEMACDETVLAKSDADERIGYASALLDTARSRLRVVSPFGGAPLRERLSHILSYRRMTVVSVLASIVLFGSMAYTLLTNAV